MKIANDQEEPTRRLNHLYLKHQIIDHTLLGTLTMLTNSVPNVMMTTAILDIQGNSHRSLRTHNHHHLCLRLCDPFVLYRHHHSPLHRLLLRNQPHRHDHHHHPRRRCLRCLRCLLRLLPLPLCHHWRWYHQQKRQPRANK